MYTPFNPSNAAYRQLILDAINCRLDAAAVYCFAHRNTTANYASAISGHAGQEGCGHFYVAVLAASFPQNCIADIAFLVNERSAGKCTVTVVCARIPDLYGMPPCQRHFFGSIIQRTEQVYLRQGFGLQSFEVPPLGFESTRKYWQARSETAGALLRAAAASNGEDAAQVRVLLLAQAVEQLCLGLLGVYCGHRPQHFHLGYLLDLCLCFTSIPNECLPRQTPDDRRLFAILCDGLWALRHKPRVPFHSLDAQILHERVGRFFAR